MFTAVDNLKDMQSLTLGVPGVNIARLFSRIYWAQVTYPIEYRAFTWQEIEVQKTHELTLQVRDYECDLQGVVNNAVYMNYLEHARHEYLLSRGVDFAEVTREGIHLVVVRAELDYKSSLTSGDAFRVSTHFERRGRLKIVFHQAIHRVSDQALMLSGRITAVALNAKGRPFVPEDILALLS